MKFKKMMLATGVLCMLSSMPVSVYADELMQGSDLTKEAPVVSESITEPVVLTQEPEVVALDKDNVVDEQPAEQAISEAPVSDVQIAEETSADTVLTEEVVPNDESAVEPQEVPETPEGVEKTDNLVIAEEVQSVEEGIIADVLPNVVAEPIVELVAIEEPQEITEPVLEENSKPAKKHKNKIHKKKQKTVTKKSAEDLEKIALTYKNYNFTEGEIRIIAQVMLHEAKNQPELGQIAVVEVILNRLYNESFPDTVEEVVYQKGQFSRVRSSKYIEPTKKELKLVKDIIEGKKTVLNNSDILYFKNPWICNRVKASVNKNWGSHRWITSIGDHAFYEG